MLQKNSANVDSWKIENESDRTNYGSTLQQDKNYLSLVMDHMYSPNES